MLGRVGFVFVVGVVFLLFNLLNIMYWVVLGGIVMMFGVVELGWIVFLVFFGGFMLLLILWCFVCVGFIVVSRCYVGKVLWFLINVGCVIGLVIFGYMVVMNVIIGNWERFDLVL